MRRSAWVGGLVESIGGVSALKMTTSMVSIWKNHWSALSSRFRTKHALLILNPRFEPMLLPRRMPTWIWGAEATMSPRSGWLRGMSIGSATCDFEIRLRNRIADKTPLFFCWHKKKLFSNPSLRRDELNVLVPDRWAEYDCSRLS